MNDDTDAFVKGVAIATPISMLLWWGFYVLVTTLGRAYL